MLQSLLSIFIGLLFCLLIYVPTYAQNIGLEEDEIQEVVEEGPELNFRSIYMNTHNRSYLPDYHAMAVGGYLKWTSGKLYGFRFGAAFYQTNELFKNFSREDGSELESRYEASLFDISFEDTREISLLGEVNIRYKFKENTITLGRMRFNSPLINDQDTRMTPSFVAGIWGESKQLDRFTLGLGYFSHNAPRSSSRFYSIANSLGISGESRAITGEEESYQGNVSTAGIFLGNVRFHDPDDDAYFIDVWNYYTENIFNSLHMEGRLKRELGPADWEASLMFVQQNRLSQGGNPELEKAYFQNRASRFVSSRLEAERSKNKYSLAYTHILPGGRYLHPREWGVEQTYTNPSRERTEGTANTHEWLLLWERNYDRVKGLTTKTSYGVFRRPDVLNVANNKYLLPSFHQVFFSVEYSFGGAFNGMNLEAFFTRKIATGPTYSNPEFVHNKVDMNHVSIILNYTIPN
jgi:hypothetical protein